MRLLRGVVGSKHRPWVAAGHNLIDWHRTCGIVHIHGQFLSAAGGFLGAPFQMSGDTRSQVAPALAAAKQGFIATWRGLIPSCLGIRSVELDHLGGRVGDEIEVTRTGVSRNYRTNVAAGGEGGFLISWEPASAAAASSPQGAWGSSAPELRESPALSSGAQRGIWASASKSLSVLP